MTPVDFSILLVGSAQQTSLEQMYRRAFMANGIMQVDLLDLEGGKPVLLRNKVLNRLLPGAGHNYSARLLIDHLSSCNSYRWIFIFKGMQFSLQVLQQCRRLAPYAIWVNINPDDPYNLESRAASNSNVMQSRTFYDVYCIWSHLISNKLRADGCKRVLYLPFGYDETFHQPHATSKLDSEAPVSFIGTWDRERELILAQLAGYNVCIHGPNWGRASSHFPLRDSLSYLYVNFGSEMSSIMSSSAICLNLLRPQNRGSHNMRTFEIPAMGGLMLTNRTEEQQELFPENEACYMYGDFDELKSKIDYILANKSDAHRVRARGIALVRTHSYTNRARDLLQQLAIMYP
jgi:spore maturation protein CgeB